MAKVKVDNGTLRIDLDEGGAVGLENGRLTVFAARRREGKTAFALSLAAAANASGRLPVLLVSYDHWCLENRWFSTIYPLIPPDEAADILYDDEHAMDDVDVPLRVRDSHGTIEDLRTLCLDAFAAPEDGEKPRLIVVDHLQRIGCEEDSNLHEFATKSMRVLKSLAAELDVPVLLLVNLWRLHHRVDNGLAISRYWKGAAMPLYRRDDRSPRLSDLPEVVSNGADSVWMLERDLRAPKSEELDPPDDLVPQPAKVHVLKRADGGPPGAFSLKWLPRSASFSFEDSNAEGDYSH